MPFPPSPRSAAKTVLLTGAAAAALIPAARATHRRLLTWGATPAEQVMSLPGDGLVPLADLVATRAIDVAAPPEAVWPWLAQIGMGRGGFYSYDVLENLIGLGIHSADAVVPEWQVTVGDQVHLAEGFGLDVAIAEPGSALVLHGAPPADPDDADEGTGENPAPYTFSWAFVLVPRDGGTRLLVRERYGYAAPWAGRLVTPVSWVSWLMTQRMLRGIRDRAQRPAS